MAAATTRGSRDDATIPAHERYNYLYSTEELAPWVTRIHKVSEHARDTFVVTNNHFQGKAVVNALQLISILKGSKVKVPEPLRQHYPQLGGDRRYSARRADAVSDE